MTFNGFVRNVNRVSKSIERDAKKRQRELEQRKKEYSKMQELEQASYAVEEYENDIEILQSLHKECSERIDWKDIASTKEPEKPVNVKTHEKEATLKLEKYHPSLIDKLFKREEKQQQKLKMKIEQAIVKDEEEYRIKFNQWEKELSDWKNNTDIANALLSDDKDTKMKVIEEMNSFSEISSIGSEISISINDKNIVEAKIYVHGSSIIPNEVKSLLKSGKLSVKEMPKSQFYTLYQDYVCSAILRIANELFAIIPDNVVIVTAIDNLLNDKTGHLEKLPIVSACISRNTLASLNMYKIDPSNSMSNFIHNMSFKKTSGFSEVSFVDINQIEK